MIKRIFATFLKQWSRIHPANVLRSLVSCRFQNAPMDTCRTRTNKPKRRHQCGIGQEPSESQVREWEIFKNSIVRELEIIFCISGKRVSVAYIVVSSELRSLRCRDRFLWRVLGVRAFVILKCLSKWDRHMSVIRPWYVMCRTFSYTSIHGDHAGPFGFSILWILWSIVASIFSSVWGVIVDFGVVRLASIIGLSRILHHLFVKSTTL